MSADSKRQPAASEHDAFRVAAVQTVSTPDPAENMQSVARLVREAVQAGAQLVVLPEYWAILGHRETDKVAHAEAPGQGPLQDFMSALAREATGNPDYVDPVVTWRTEDSSPSGLAIVDDVVTTGATVNALAVELSLFAMTFVLNVLSYRLRKRILKGGAT